MWCIVVCVQVHTPEGTLRPWEAPNTHVFFRCSGHPLICIGSCLCLSPLLFIRAGISFIGTAPDTCVRACRGLLVRPFSGRASPSRVACACQCFQPLVCSVKHVDSRVFCGKRSKRTCVCYAVLRAYAVKTRKSRRREGNPEVPSRTFPLAWVAPVYLRFDVLEQWGVRCIVCITPSFRADRSALALLDQIAKRGAPTLYSRCSL